MSNTCKYWTLDKYSPISTQLLEDLLGYIKPVTHHTKLAQKSSCRLPLLYQD